jgi:glycerol-3-phosphate dehydrogenase
MMYRVAVIGGGVVGAAVAYELSHYIRGIVLLEKEEELSFGVSKANSGIVHPGTQNAPGSLKGRLCVEGNARIREMADDLGLDFKQVGELIVAFDDAEVERLWQLKQEAEELGVRQLDIVPAGWLRENEPNLSCDAVAALYAPSAGIISPYRFVYALAKGAEENHVEIRTSSKVARIDRQGNGYTLTTSSGNVSAEYVVNCAGLYADEIAEMVGRSTFRIRPRKGEEYILDKKRRYLTRHLLFPVPTPQSKGILVTRTSDGNPMIGPTAYEVHDKEDVSTTDDGLQQVLQVARRLVPSIDPCDIIAYFAGLRPVAGDDFIIGAMDGQPGFVNVAGIQSPGLTAAPAIAAQVVGALHQLGLYMERRGSARRVERTFHLFERPLAQAAEAIEQYEERGDIVCRCEVVSLAEVREAIADGATTLDGIKFRTRAGAGRCHGSFCTCRLMHVLSDELGKPMTSISKRGKGSELVVEDRTIDGRA